MADDQWLDQDLAGEPPDLTGAEQDALRHAEWHLRNLRKVRSEKIQLEHMYRSEFERLGEAYEARMASLTERERAIEEPLRQLMARLREADPTRKSVRLVWGALKSREVPAAVVVEADDVALTWAKHFAPAYVTVKTTETIDRSKLAKDVVVTPDGRPTIDGEIVPGLAVRPGRVAVTIDTLEAQ